jgi:hypothetical protein
VPSSKGPCPSGIRISRRATVPGRQRWGFFTPPKDLVRLCAAFVAR